MSRVKLQEMQVIISLLMPVRHAQDGKDILPKDSSSLLLAHGPEG